MMMPWFWTWRARRLATRLPLRAGPSTLGDLLEEYRTRYAQSGRLAAEARLFADLRSLRRAYRRAPEFAPRSPAAWIQRGDLVHALRALRSAPWYAATLAGVIALGIALSATVFAMVDGPLFKPLPYRDGNRLFAVTLGWSKLPEPLRAFRSISPAEFLAWQSEAGDVALTALAQNSRQTVGTRDYVRALSVDRAFFDVLGAHAAVGGFSADDFSTKGPIVPAVVTHGFWQRRLASDVSSLGRVLVDDAGTGIRVVGVLPADFVFPFVAMRDRMPEVLTPRPTLDARNRTASLQVLLRAGRAGSEQAAAARLSAAMARRAAEIPPGPTPPGLPERNRITRGPYDRAGLEPIRDALTTDLTDNAWIVFAAATALILLACLNMTSLGLARVHDRWRDLAVRRALGAGVLDLIRMLSLEYAVVIAVGVAAGLAGAHAMIGLTLHLIGDSYMLALKAPAIDGRLLAFTALVAVGCLAFVTLFSARAAARVSGRPTLADGGGTTVRTRARVSMITVEVAIALILAVGGALVAGSLIRVWHEDPGFDPAHTALLSMSTPRGASGADIEMLVARWHAIPGVASIGSAGRTILARSLNSSVFDRPPGVPEPVLGWGFPVESWSVTHGYLQAAGLRAIDGRLPTDDEFSSGAAVMVVSRGVATEYWPGQRAVGQALSTKGRPFTVVGVVPDARYVSLDFEPRGAIYWPVAATPEPLVLSTLVRLESGGSDALPAVVRQVIERCPSCQFQSAQMLTDAMSATIRPRQFSAWLFSSFAISALAIVGAGVLGLVAMTTTRRRREIGIRMALGATGSGVTWQIVREQLMAVGAGILAGGLVAAWLVRYVATYLYKTPLDDPRSWGAAVAALVLVSVLASLIPSYRASRVDPVRALKAE